MRALLFAKCNVPLLVAVLAVATIARAQDSPGPTMTLVVDETQAVQRLAFIHEEIRVRPGTITLAYPRWIPGEHGPTGPIEQVAGLRIHAGDVLLSWTRNPADINSFRVDVPAGTDRITVDFDTLLQGAISAHQLLLAWSTAVLYPLGVDKTALIVEPSVLLPPNWKQGSSLHVTGQIGNRVKFAPLSLERLIDSPILASDFFRAVPLASVWPAELDITGNSQESVDKADDEHAVTLFAKLVDQDRAMFGFRHWDTLHLLVAQVGLRFFDGLEHEDSPWNGIGEEGLSKKDELEAYGWPLLAHEQSHSWDGKYRRPAEFYSKPDYQGPEQTTLLWVYEGLNEYIGKLLATRAGFNDAEYMRNELAHDAADYSIEPGRTFTPLVDTSTDNWVIRNVDSGWMSLRRSQDYYDEGSLIWLRADCLIREQSHDRLSLDDFLRSFFGQRDTGPIVNPYTREDVEATLSAVLPYDWHSFFETRVYQVNTKPPTDGLEASGWRLVYNATPNTARFENEFTPIEYYGQYSIGMEVNKDASIYDVLAGSPAYNAGLGPHMTIVAVDGRAYTADVLNESIAQPQGGKITVIVRNFDSVETHVIQYAGGVRYPHLERIPGSHDYLSEILATRTYQAH
jgi:predicted metalloprotease with PDZ domain